ncbi:phosphate propanoyltransferase [Maledivibacter halophilus]|uniref:Phosphate propanoyltransferase n=1 Tax=Maledivibacter halophilus TaxID=36842 RepID=A0A1T5MKY1_9FIRM|nr:phosphate propanoyltransferase [Maledivibacter halophilus]SKC88568.1 Propanediol utilization protein [Maledivibacter halophilus]
MEKQDLIYQKLLELIKLDDLNNEHMYKNTPASSASIPVGISNRHVHLSQSDVSLLYGENYQLTPYKELAQPGQCACKETVILCGPKGALERVRVIGPARVQTQVEILSGDCFALGIKAPVRISGDISGSSGLTIIGPKGSIQLTEGVIVAQRHIHMHPEDAKRFSVENEQVVKIEVDGPRGGILNHVLIRVSENSALECHIDVEEANALGVQSSSSIKIIE